jgi:hypothetical protein
MIVKSITIVNEMCEQSMEIVFFAIKRDMILKHNWIILGPNISYIQYTFQIQMEYPYQFVGVSNMDCKKDISNTNV